MFNWSLASGNAIDSLQNVLKQETNSIQQGYIAIAILENYANLNIDSAFSYAYLAEKKADLALSKNKNAKSANGLKGAALFNIAALHHKGAFFDKAKKYYLMAIAFLEKSDKKELLAKNISYLGRIYEREGKPLLFKANIFKALKIQQEIKDSNGMAYSYASLGDLYARQNDFDSCEICYREAFAILAKTKNLRSLAFSLQNYGSLLKARNEYSKAVENFYKALAIQKKIKDESGMLYTLINIGSIHKELKEYHIANNYYNQALAINKKVNDRSIEVKVLQNKGDIKSGQNKHEEAIAYYKSALKLMKAIDIGPNVTANCLTDLADEYLKINDPSTALNLVNQALALGKDITMPADLARRYLTKGNINIQLNYLMEAILVLDSAIAIGQNGDLKEVLSEGYFLRALLAEKQGNFKEAVNYLKIHNAFKDSLNLISTEKLLIQKEANFQIQQTKNENILNLQKISLLKREQSLKNKYIVGLIILFALLSVFGFLFFRNYKNIKEARELKVSNELKTSNLELEVLRERVNTLLLSDQGKPNNLALNENINQFLDEPLSQRELDVLNELSTGKSNQEISDVLFVSVNTVRTHLVNIYHKLDVKNRTQAVKKAANLNTHE